MVTGERLLREFDIIVVDRPGVPALDQDDVAARFGSRVRWLSAGSRFNIIGGNLSSTEIRRRLRAAVDQSKVDDAEEQAMSQQGGRPKLRREDSFVGARGGLQWVDGLVPPGVLSYIRRHRLCLLYTSPSPRDS